MQVDRARLHLAKEMILHPHRPGVAIAMRPVAADEAAVFSLDPCDPIHSSQFSNSVAPVTSHKGRGSLPDGNETLFQRAVQLRKWAVWSTLAGCSIRSAPTPKAS